MKKYILLSLLLALPMTKAIAENIEVTGFDGPTWYNYIAQVPEGVNQEIFDYVLDGIFEGSGTSDAPFLIKTPEQLAWIAYQVNVKGEQFFGKSFRLAANIDLTKRNENGDQVLWVPIGLGDNTHEFWGSIDNPNNYVIYKMLIRAKSTETTSYFGLFGNLMSSVTGIILEDAEIEITEIQDEYYAGLLCGRMTSSNMIEYWYDYQGGEHQTNNGVGIAKVKNCLIQGNSRITACGNSNQPYVGGLVGWFSTGKVNYSPELSSCIVRLENMTLNGTGTIIAGGVVGNMSGKILYDCHTVLKEMNVSGLSEEDASYIGGVAGGCVNSSTLDNTVKFCTSSGDITVKDNSKVYMGGIMGFNTYHSKISLFYDASAVTLTGGHTVGGLLGYGNPRNRTGYSNDNLTPENCVYNGYINGEDATYVGGLFGYLDFGEKADANILSNTAFNYFCGTMKKPKNSEYYGVIMGYANNLKNIKQICHFGYDRCACDMQTNGQGLDLSWQTSSFVPPRPKEGEYSNYRNGVLHPTSASGSEGQNLCFYDNYAICDIPFHITNDWNTYYKATDVTVDFTIEDFRNKSTGEKVASFTVPDNVTCVKVDGKHLYPLDPGEVVVSVKWNGLQRKVHLDITYGKDWEGGKNEVFDGGDGTEVNPFIIHNADQFYSASRIKNKPGVYLKLASDIFFNTHLLQENGTPRTNARKWVPIDFQANLDGNGKTIYGVYVNMDGLADGETLGMFNNFYGTVKNLAIVDSNVSTNDASYYGTSTGLLCGTLKDGASVTNCLFHGRVSADNFCGGIAGLCDNNTSITDCFASVHITWPEQGSHPSGAGGICYSTPATLERCISTGRVEKFIWDYGLSENSLVRNACYFDIQMQAGKKYQSQIIQESAMTTDELVNNDLMGGFSAWQQDEECYPMLSTFADTPYGKLLVMPIYFDKPDGSDCYDADRAGDVNYIFEFPTKNVTWSALHDDTYIDVINDCGAASIVEKTNDGVEILMAEAENVESQCTRARRTLPLNTRTGLTSFRFKDPVAQRAAEAAFDKEAPIGTLTLRELVEAKKNDFAVFNREAKRIAGVEPYGLQWFPEFRYFTATTKLEEGMLSGLDELSELQLPKKLKTIDTNAFNGCDSLKEITLPATFTTLNEGGLFGSGIKDVLVNPKHETMESIDGALFDMDYDGKRHLVAYPPGRGEADATISTHFEYIDDYAFYKIPELRNIYIDNCLPEGNLVLSVGDYPIIHESANDKMHIFVNDGSYDSRLFSQYINDFYWGDEYYDVDHLHIYYPLNMTSAGWATLYIGFPTQLPEGFNAYVVKEMDEQEHQVTLKNIGRVIPGTFPVVIKNADTDNLKPGVYPLTRWEGAISDDIVKYDNRLVGTYIGQEGKWGIKTNQETSITGGTLTLGRNSQGVVGFFKYNGEVVPPYRAYLTFNTITDEAKGYSFIIDDTIDDMTTLVQRPMSNAQQSANVYDIMGRPLQGKPTRRGIYISNGKKVVVK